MLRENDGFVAARGRAAVPLPPVARRSFREDGTDLMVAKVHGEHRSIEDTTLNIVKLLKPSNRSQATP